LTRLVDMAELRELLGVRSGGTRALVRRLKAIAAERAPDRPIPFFKLAGRWVIPRAELLDLIPELAGDQWDLGAVVDRQADEIADLRNRLERLERILKNPTLNNW
jgi:hypothetical protein